MAEIYKFDVMFDILMSVIRKEHAELNFQLIAEKLAAAVGVERCVIAKINKDCGTYNFVAGVAIAGSSHTFGVDYRIDNCPTITKVLRTKAMNLRENPVKDPECYYMHDLIRDINIKSILFMPVLDDQDEVSFVIILDAINKKEAFSEVEIKFVNNIATLINELPKYALKYELERRILALGKASNAIAHEIRNPLVSLGGFARRAKKLVDEGKINVEELKKYLQLCIEAVLKVEAIVTDVLEYPQTDKRLRLEKIDLREFLISFLNGESVITFNKAVPVRVKSFGSGFPVEIDKGKFETVFRNLILNAIQHVMTLSGEKRFVDITLNRQAKFIEVIISNPGAVDDFQKIFQEGYSTKEDGRGWGLSIVEDIIVAHQKQEQKISLKPRQRGGRVEFVIRFPLSAA